MPSNPLLEARLKDRLTQVSEQSAALGYSPHYFNRMLRELGAVRTVQELLPNMSSGFTELFMRGRLDLSVEAVMLEEGWRELFSDAERAIARKRLTEAKYKFPPQVGPTAPATRTIPNEESRATRYRPAVEAVLRTATTPMTAEELQARVIAIVTPTEDDLKGVESQPSLKNWEHTVNKLAGEFVGDGLWAEGRDVVRTARGVYLSRLNAAEPFREDAIRDRKLVSVLDRPGQAGFKASLMRCHGQCQISRCDVIAVLHGCHIKRVEHHGSDAAENGLLLRSDIHTLFDADLIAINPETFEVHIAPSLMGTAYAEFAGRPLLLGRGIFARPDLAALGDRWKVFRTRTNG